MSTSDRDLVLKLGEYIIDLQAEVDALQSLLMEYKEKTPDGRLVEIPWRKQALEIGQQPDHVEVSAAQRRDLLQAVGGETDASTLIRLLYQKIRCTDQGS